ncbi:MAG: diguanylate cyclase response regulator [bacterium]|nr:diguanylate cyclase response regulator [bacterium]
MMSNTKPIILVVDDDNNFAAMVCAFFSHYGYSVVLARGYNEAVEVIRQNPGRIVAFIDLHMPGEKDGYDLLALINRQMRHRVLAYALTGDPDQEARRRALKTGAIHAFKKGEFGDLDWDDILIHAENDVATRLTEDATRDDRTGLLLLTVFDQIVEAELRSSRSEMGGPEDKKKRAYHHPNVFALATLDMDHFKEVNDTHGHETGHKALRAVAGLIQEQIRLSDHSCRSGGDEFSIFFLAADKATADGICKKLQERVAKAVVLDHEGRRVDLSISFGVADIREAQINEDVKISLDDLKERSDKTLRDAKVAQLGGLTKRAD